MLEITLRISTENVEKFAPNYFTERPVPLDGEGALTMTPLEWFKQRTIADIMKVCRRGQQKLALQITEDLGEIIE